MTLAVRGRTILIAGEPGTGKSWLAGLVCEQLILQHYCVCIIDPEGDYRSLETLPGVIMLGGDDPPPSAREIIKALRHPDVSLVVDLSRMSHHQKGEYVRTLLPLLNTLRRRTGLPHKILLDEAHYYIGGEDTGTLHRRRARRVHPRKLPDLGARRLDPRDIRCRRHGDA